MNMRHWITILIFLGLTLNLSATPSTITYQGQLQDATGPVTDTHEMTFRLFDSEAGAGQIGSEVSFSAVSVEDGLFQVELDFGSDAFSQGPRYLEVEVAGSVLDPRQRIAPTPTALNVLNMPDTEDTLAELDCLSNEVAAFDGSQWVCADVSGYDTLAGLDCGNEEVPQWDGSSWQCGQVMVETGWTLPNNHWVTTDRRVGIGVVPDSDFHFKLAGEASFGSPENMTSAGSRYVMITGGADDEPNEAYGARVFIGGGRGHLIQSQGASLLPDAAIVGGSSSAVQATASGILAGHDNSITGEWSAIVGGRGHSLEGQRGFIGGGDNATLKGTGSGIIGGWANENSDGFRTFIGAGSFNETAANESAIIGGRSNRTDGPGSAIAGGENNSVAGERSFIAAGRFNEVAGDFAMAGGFRAAAAHDYSFVWADGSDLTGMFSTTGPNQFLVQADGGVGINTNTPLATFDVKGDTRLGGAVAIDFSDENDMPPEDGFDLPTLYTLGTDDIESLYFGTSNSAEPVFRASSFRSLNISRNFFTLTRPLEGSLTGQAAELRVEGFATIENSLSVDGNIEVDGALLAGGPVGINTINPQYELDVDGTIHGETLTSVGQMIVGSTLFVNSVGGVNGTQELCRVPSTGLIAECSSSSLRYKHAVEAYESGWERVQSLRPVSYRFIENEQPDVGLIAEELAEIDERLVVFDAEGRPDSIRYGRLTVLLIAAMQEREQGLQHKLAEQADRDAEVSERLAALEAENTELRQLAERNAELEDRLARLESLLTDGIRTAEVAP